MTDYSSQGKTREFNVVDLKECRNFQAVYTCLSRGTSLAGTLIIRDFEDNLLTVITDLLYNGLLPPHIIMSTRWDTIHAYRDWKRGAGMNMDAAPAFPEDNDLSVKRRKTVHNPQPILANSTWAAPTGPVWDGHDWSCAYDAWTFLIQATACER